MSNKKHGPRNRATERLSNLVLEGGRQQQFGNGFVGRDAKTGRFLPNSATAETVKKNGK
jgi:hypothetical protein